MRKSSRITDFIKEKPYLVWYVKDFENLSEESIIENTLNYGEFEDIKKMISIIGMQKVAGIFFRQVKRRRNNYRKEIAHYFKLYFKKHG